MELGCGSPGTPVSLSVKQGGWGCCSPKPSSARMTQGPQEANSPPLPSGRRLRGALQCTGCSLQTRMLLRSAGQKDGEGRGDIHEIPAGLPGARWALETGHTCHPLPLPHWPGHTWARLQALAQQARLPAVGVFRAKGERDQHLPGGSYHTFTEFQINTGLGFLPRPLPEAIGAKLCLAALQGARERAGGADG